MCVSCLATNATVKRGRRGFVRRAAAVGVMLLTVAVVACPVQAGLIRYDGDYMYLTEDFEVFEGGAVPPPIVSDGPWNAYAFNAQGLWHPFSHQFLPLFPEAAQYADVLFPFANNALDFALISNETSEYIEGMVMAVRPAYQDLVTLPECEILQFSVDVFVTDAFSGDFYDYHSIDLVGTEGRLRYFLPLHRPLGGGTYHVSISATEYGGLIGDMYAVGLQSPYACFDNLTVKTWRYGAPPTTPEPGLFALAAGGLGICMFRRNRKWSPDRKD